jgi:dihydroorotate dehydrogenase electron transfer subunit
MTNDDKEKAVIKEWLGKIVSNRDAGGSYKVLTISVSTDFPEPLAGAFVMLDCGFMEDGTILRRPMAFYDVRKKSTHVEVDILYHVVGKGTALMGKMKPDESTEFLGPLGNSFSIPNKQEKIWIVGGGIGIAPFLLWMKQIQHKQNVKMIFGFREDAQLKVCDDFKEFKQTLTTCVQNGNRGDFQGTVVDALKMWLEAERPDKIFTCGPTIMMDKTIEVAKAHNIPVEVSLEAKMGCGIGVCLSCVTPLEHQHQKSTFSLVCKDGPIFTV